VIVSKPVFHDLVAAVTDWRKSDRSDNSGPYCLELAEIVGTGAVALRDSTAPHGPVLVFTATEIAAFVEGAKAGQFDHLL
jgi:hypothetical protein